jgi:hypothetical protein
MFIDFLMICLYILAHKMYKQKAGGISQLGQSKNKCAFVEQRTTSKSACDFVE